MAGNNPFLAVDIPEVRERVQKEVLQELSNSNFETDEELIACCEKLSESELFNEDTSALIINFLTEALSSSLVVDQRYRIYALLYIYLHHHQPANYRHTSIPSLHLHLPPAVDVFIPLLNLIRRDAESLAEIIKGKDSADVWGGKEKVVKMTCMLMQVTYYVSHLGLFKADDLSIFNEPYVGLLFDLVEATRDPSQEILNDSLMRLLLSLNDQFLSNDIHDNVVFSTLCKRVEAIRTFGENVVFLLNRSRNPTTHILIMKLLYLIFTTPTSVNLFYTNDLKVLVDVIVRELYNSEIDSGKSLRHAYLRVLQALLSNTRVSTLSEPYKKDDIKNIVRGLHAEGICPDNMDETTKRLAKRIEEECLMNLS